LAAAISVLFSHAFLIAEGSDKHEPLVVLSGNQGILGLLGVFVFFTMSGFLVTQSFESAPSLRRFLAARLLRIYPGLIVCLLICAFAIGAVVTSLPFLDYLQHPGTLRFLSDNLLMRGFDESLPGVLFIDNAVGLVVGGSFWSLRFEIYCYFMVAALGFAGLLNVRSAVILLALGLAASRFDLLGGFGWLLPYFAVGMVMYYLSRRWAPSALLAVAAALGLAATILFGEMLFAFSLLGGYLTIFLATSPSIRLPRAARFGDLSYGLYIYRWPVEASVAYAIGDAVAWWQVFLIGTAISLALAFLSWHGIEKRALRLKSRPPAPTLVAPAPA
jgi:peptidoglycan/LPS O-acetylase OafA/YrhL